MASPQPDQFTKFSNELLEALMTVKMSGSEWQFVMCLFRKTYGFNKKEDWITNSQICKAIGLPKERVSEAKKRLLARKIVTEKRNKISIQKDYDLWVELRKSVTVVTEKRNKVLRKSVNTKEKKETITKETCKPSLLNEKTMENVKSNGTLIGEVIKEFEAIDPKNKTYYNNKSQRAACDFLLAEYGLEEIKKRIEVLPKTNTMPYFPNITTPCQLRDSWVKLNNQIERHKTEQGAKSNLVAF